MTSLQTRAIPEQLVKSLERHSPPQHADERRLLYSRLESGKGTWPGNAAPQLDRLLDALTGWLPSASARSISDAGNRARLLLQLFLAGHFHRCLQEDFSRHPTAIRIAFPDARQQKVIRRGGLRAPDQSRSRSVTDDGPRILAPTRFDTCDALVCYALPDDEAVREYFYAFTQTPGRTVKPPADWRLSPVVLAGSRDGDHLAWVAAQLVHAGTILALKRPGLNERSVCTAIAKLASLFYDESVSPEALRNLMRRRAYPFEDQLEWNRGVRSNPVTRSPS